MISIIEVMGDSMLPHLKSGDLLLCRKTRLDSLKTGKIIVIKSNGKTMIKRLVGLPGQTVELHGGRLIRDGMVVKESFTRHSDSIDYIWILQDDEYLFLGDNALNSLDSRKLGPFRSNAIIGQIFLRLWPIGRLIS